MKKLRLKLLDRCNLIYLSQCRDYFKKKMLEECSNIYLSKCVKYYCIKYYPIKYEIKCVKMNTIGCRKFLLKIINYFTIYNIDTMPKEIVKSICEKISDDGFNFWI